MKKQEEYFASLIALMERVADTQKAPIEAAVNAIAISLEQGGMIYAFGTGHSHMLAEELFYRAGGLVSVYPLFDDPLMLHINATRSSRMEQLPGYAVTLLEDGPELKEGDVMLIFSNSGRNAAPIEMAIEAKKRGLTVICITNLAHSGSVTSRHPNGKKLYELSDIVIDNCGVIGDASMEIGEVVTGSTSSAVGTAILQAIVCGVVEKMQEDGFTPEVFSSSNIDHGAEKNAAYLKKYKKIIPFL